MYELSENIVVNGQKCLYWWSSKSGNSISNTHIDELKQNTEKQIAQTMQNGYSAGSLLHNVYDEGLDGEVEYKGGWSSVE
jgi:hypothetical protein